MGGFVVKPLQEELAEACQHDKALADARRCLEVLVPLAYRPAIKVCCPAMRTFVNVADIVLIHGCCAPEFQVVIMVHARVPT